MMQVENWPRLAFTRTCWDFSLSRQKQHIETIWFCLFVTKQSFLPDRSKLQSSVVNYAQNVVVGRSGRDLKCWGAWDTTCGHKAKDITWSIAWRRERRRKRKRSTIFGERARERPIVNERKGHRESDQHWNGFTCNTGETSERRGGAFVADRF